MKTDAEFINALADSQAAVDLVAAHLRHYGAQITVPEVKVRPSFAQRMDYQDQGDILLTQRIEVKHKQIDFTCADDYPFETVMLDAAYKIDAMPWGHLHSYVLVNRAKTHAGLVKSSSRPQWSQTTVYDRKERERRAYYVAPVSVTWFFPLQQES